MAGTADPRWDARVVAQVQHARQALQAFLDALEALQDAQEDGHPRMPVLFGALQATTVDAVLVWQDYLNLFELIEYGCAARPDEARSWGAGGTEG